jgi:hypothetical protein
MNKVAQRAPCLSSRQERGELQIEKKRVDFDEYVDQYESLLQE